jgi:hypothetical protein
MSHGMKRNTIAKVIEAKIDSWINTVEDVSLRSALSRDTIVTGGAIASMMLGEPVNDYDIYFRTKSTAIAIANYYADKMNFAIAMRDKTMTVPVGTLHSAVYKDAPKIFAVHEITRTNVLKEEEERIVIWTGNKYKAEEVEAHTRTRLEESFEAVTEEEIETEEAINAAEVTDRVTKFRQKATGEILWISENAITLKGKIQIIFRFFGEPAELHRNYDFAHAMGSYDHHTRSITLPEEAMEALLSKTLIYKGSLYPVASMFRLRKFIARGWRITAGQMLKIAFQINKVDFSDPHTMREQLIGVDMLYMWQLIKEIESLEPGERIDSHRVSQMIDTIFD